MNGWRDWLPRWRGHEHGFSEAATAIFVLPLLALLIFMLIETGMNIRYRLLVDNIVQTAVRGVALDGGNCNPRTSTCTPSTAGTRSWSARATADLQQLCRDSGRATGSCASLVVQCRPNSSAAEVGDEVRCWTTFPYKPLTGLARNPVTSLGFSGLFTDPIDVTIYSSAGVGQS